MSRCLFRAVLVASVLSSCRSSSRQTLKPRRGVGARSCRACARCRGPSRARRDRGAVQYRHRPGAASRRATSLAPTASTDLGDGAYRVNVAIDGFAPASRDATPGSRVDIELRPAQVVESVTVVSGARQAELRESLSTPVNVVDDEPPAGHGSQQRRRSAARSARRSDRRGSEGTAVAGEQVQGIDSRQVLVLVDGQPVAGARGIKSGAINLDRQSTYRLERVEIVKGAASALFGSDAIGGVINLITRDSAAPFEADGHGFRWRARNLRCRRKRRRPSRAVVDLRQRQPRRARQLRSDADDGRHDRRAFHASRWLRPLRVPPDIRADAHRHRIGLLEHAERTRRRRGGPAGFGRRRRVAGRRRECSLAGRRQDIGRIARLLDEIRGDRTPGHSSRRSVVAAGRQAVPVAGQG